MNKTIDVGFARAAAGHLLARTIIADPADPDTCLLWTGGTNSNGIGRASLSDETYCVHRVLWVADTGRDPGHLDLHPRCGNATCVRVDHREALTRAEVLSRGNSTCSHALRTGRCVHGHEYTTANTGRDARGRYCRACRRLARKAG